MTSYSNTKTQSYLMAALTLALAALMGGTVSAQELTLTGSLTDIGGSPLNESVEIEFRLFPQAENGASLWSETLGVEVRDGEFVAVLEQRLSV